MRATLTILAPVALLATAACGTGGGDASHAASNETANAAAPATPEPAAVTCTDRPEFVPVEADARIATCTSGTTETGGRLSGTIAYTTASPPPEVLARARAHALQAGLELRIEAPNLLSAGEGEARTLMIITSAAGGTTNVTVNWGVAKSAG